MTGQFCAISTMEEILEGVDPRGERYLVTGVSYSGLFQPLLRLPISPPVGIYAKLTGPSRDAFGHFCPV